jgi:hypothetical protein
MTQEKVDGAVFHGDTLMLRGDAGLGEDARPYRKRPVVIEAVQMRHKFAVETLEGTMRGEPGDYLIKGVKGELYPCKPDIFEATYEPVE